MSYNIEKMPTRSRKFKKDISQIKEQEKKRKKRRETKRMKKITKEMFLYPL